MATRTFPGAAVAVGMGGETRMLRGVGRSAVERPDKGVAQQAELVAHGARLPNYGSAASRYVADATYRVRFAGLARVW